MKDFKHKKYIVEGFDDSFNDDETDYADVASGQDYETRKNKITAWLAKWDINYSYNSGKYKINDDWSVDVDGDVDISYINRAKSDGYIRGIDSTHKLTEIGIQFGIVNGSFDCSHNELTSLKGCPKKVYGDFDCSHNKLTSLEYSPEHVGKQCYRFTYNCSDNKLRTLKGFPKSFIGEFNCSSNNLTSLKFGPAVCDAGYNCANNYLTSLEYAPKEIPSGGFVCSDNNLTSLEHCPDIDVNYYIIVKNNGLVDLTGCPKQFGGIQCSGNPLKSLRGAPQHFAMYMYYRDSAVPIDPGRSCDIPGIKLVNDFVDRAGYEAHWEKMNGNHVSESFDDSFNDDEGDYSGIFDKEDVKKSAPVTVYLSGVQTGSYQYPENKKEFQPSYTYINAYTDHDKALNAALNDTLTALIDFTDERVFLPGNSYLRDDDDPDYENGTWIDYDTFLEDYEFYSTGDDLNHLWEQTLIPVHPRTDDCLYSVLYITHTEDCMPRGARTLFASYYDALDYVKKYYKKCTVHDCTKEEMPEGWEEYCTADYVDHVIIEKQPIIN